MWWKQGVDVARRRVERHPKLWEVIRPEILLVRLCKSPGRYPRMQRDVLKKAFINVDVGGGMFHGEMTYQGERNPKIYRARNNGQTGTSWSTSSFQNCTKTASQSSSLSAKTSPEAVEGTVGFTRPARSK